MNNIADEDDLSNPFEYFFNNFFDIIPSPEQNLIINVLIYAVIDYIGTDKRLFNDANSWFFTEKDEKWYFSFENICFILKINKRKFQESLVELKKGKNLKSKITKLKHLNPSTGNRNKISIKLLYKEKEHDDIKKLEN